MGGAPAAPHYAGGAMLVVKKYPNRRLYDTAQSRYITLEDLAERIKAGADVLVQDVQTGADLTQATLTQIILESRGGARLLPVPLLVRLIRLGDEALAEFLGRYVSWALELYVQARSGARALMPLNPLASAPFAATDALARLMLGATQWGAPNGGGVPAGVGSPTPHAVNVPMPEVPPSVPPPYAAGSSSDMPLGPDEDGYFSVPLPPSTDVEADVARLRRELDELKRSVGAARPAKRAAKSASKSAAARAKRR